jgi:hypothetical protein
VDALIIEPPETLAELCVDTVARSLLRYDITALEGNPFSFFPGPLVSRLSTVASQHQQLVDENVEVVFTDSVEALTLHGPLTARALSALFPTVNMPNSCNSSWSLDETPEASGNSPASAVVVSGFAAGFAAGTTHLVADCWEDSVDIPAVLGVKGCSHLHSLDVSSPVLAGSFFGNIAASLPSLEKLSLRSCHDDDGRAAAALLAGLPRFTRLQFLDLSLCPWLDDKLLEYALPLLPLTEATIVGTSVFRRRVPRPKLRHLVCTGTNVHLASEALRSRMVTPTQAPPESWVLVDDAAGVSGDGETDAGMGFGKLISGLSSEAHLLGVLVSRC